MFKFKLTNIFKTIILNNVALVELKLMIKYIREIQIITVFEK